VLKSVTFSDVTKYDFHPMFGPLLKVQIQAVRESLVHYLVNSMSISKSRRSVWPITGRKKSSVMRLGVMVFKVDAVRRIRANRPLSSGWRGTRTSFRACWASYCKPSMNKDAFRPGTSADGKYWVSILSNLWLKAILQGKTWIIYNYVYFVLITIYIWMVIKGVVNF